MFTEESLKALERYRWPGNVRELQNVVERVAWMSNSREVTVADLPEEIRLAANGLLPKRERRRQLAHDLYDALVGGHYGFWDHIHALFLSRDMTRHDLRQLVRRGLTTTRGNYRLLLSVFGMPESDYKRFMNFLAAHKCVVDFHEFRGGPSAHGVTPPASFVRSGRSRPPPDRDPCPPPGVARPSFLSVDAPGSRSVSIRCTAFATAASSPAGSSSRSTPEPPPRTPWARHTRRWRGADHRALQRYSHLFMRFAIDVIFVARDGRVLKTYSALVPWRIAFGLGAFAVIELPAGTISQSEAKPGDIMQLTVPETARRRCDSSVHFDG